MLIIVEGAKLCHDLFGLLKQHNEGCDVLHYLSMYTDCIMI